MAIRNDNSVEEVKNRLDIAQVIGRYIQLKKVGPNFRGLCPFHGEKTPSFYVTPSRQIWHCFGCGEGGDVISFVQRQEHLDFRQALEMLADQAGVELPSFDPKQAAQKLEKEFLIKVNSFAAALYHHALLQETGKVALDYLRRRGLSDATIKKWQIGFCPQVPSYLLQNISKHANPVTGEKVTAQDLAKAGIYAQTDRGQFYDRFRGRVTFPLFNSRGQVVGFSARILDPEAKAAKYVNSAETLVYKKSSVLFGLFQAKDQAVKKGEVVIVEGQMDCISSSQASVENVVATSGTAFTEGHALLLKKLTDNVVLCFDSDNAGRQAQKRAAFVLMQAGLEAKVATIPEGKDPDELIRKNPQEWVLAIEKAVSLIDFYISQGQKIQDGLTRRKWLMQELLPLLNLVTEPLLREHWNQKVAQTFGASIEALERSLNEPELKHAKDRHSLLAGINVKDRELEITVLGGLISSKEALKIAREINLSAEDFSDATIKSEVERFLQVEEVGEAVQSDLTKEALFVVESMHRNLGEDSASLIDLLAKSCYRLRLKSVHLALQQAAQTLLSLQGSGRQDEIMQAQTRASELAKQRVFLEQKILN